MSKLKLDKKTYEQELRDRFAYSFMKSDFTYEFPNSAEGDLLKMTHIMLSLPETEEPEIPAMDQMLSKIKELEGLKTKLNCLMRAKGFDGEFNHRRDEYGLCFEWEDEIDAKVAKISLQEELDKLVSLPFEEAVLFLESKSV
ncbi:hypothetical protein [Listeria seeligeri]|uniref:hypothetical protein n=1 Tax=Listeria seeligeri TaxID=1640 RepID=UPI0022EB272B|nr:hypothetical protein [Listeria seeligeri]